MESNKTRYLCVHQGYELYGSDRVFLQSLRALRHASPDSHITVHLPQKGPLSIEAARWSNDVIYGNLWILRRADFGRTEIISWFRALKAAWQLSRKHDVIYINTVVVLSYLLIARFLRKPVILHIHEFTSGFSGKMLALLVRWSKASVIANSAATLGSYPDIKQKRVIWNATPEAALASQSRKSTLNLLLAGRLNDWKGHLLLLEALSLLPYQDIILRFVGSVFGNQDQYQKKIEDRIRALGLNDRVSLYPFTDNLDQHYDWADIIVVPSTRPEPFGLVAIEAMARHRPVIAAKHGGLVEIVQDRQTGLLFRPGDARDLAQAIAFYYQNPPERISHGEAGYRRFLAEFSENRYDREFISWVKSICAQN